MEAPARFTIHIQNSPSSICPVSPTLLSTLPGPQASMRIRGQIGGLLRARGVALSPEMAVGFGSTPETWLMQQGQYDLAQVRRDRIKLKRLEIA